jgi:hypothetical protein
MSCSDLIGASSSFWIPRSSRGMTTLRYLVAEVIYRDILFQKLRDSVLCRKVIICLPFPYQRVLAALYHNFSSPRTAVIVGTHRKPYAPALITARYSPCSTFWSSLSFARKSPDSQIGPTTSQTTFLLLFLTTGNI